MKTKKTWKLLLTAALIFPAVAMPSKPVNSCPWPPCEYVCRYFYPDSYCYYDECCNASCCAWNDWECINPCSP